MQDSTTGVRGAVLCKDEKKIYLDSLLKHPTTVENRVTRQFTIIITMMLYSMGSKERFLDNNNK